MNKNRTFWGLAIIFLGVILLSNSLGIWHFNVWKFIGPAFLILLGLWFIINALLGKSTAVAPQKLSIPCQEEEEFTLDLTHGAGHLNLSPSMDNTNLISGTFLNGIESTVERGRVTAIKLKASGDPMDYIFPESMHGFNWDVKINPDLPVSVTLNGGANESHLDFSLTNLKNLVLSTGASKTDVVFSHKAISCTANISAGAAEVNLTIPTDVAASIRVYGKELSSIKINNERFPQSGDRYESADYAVADKKLEIELHPGLGGITVY